MLDRQECAGNSRSPTMHTSHVLRGAGVVGRKFDIVEWARGSCAHSTMSNFRPTATPSRAG